MDIPQVLMHTKTRPWRPGRSPPGSSYGMGQLSATKLGNPNRSRRRPTPELSAKGAWAFRVEQLRSPDKLNPQR
jgi:hypothetical protein